MLVPGRRYTANAILDGRWSRRINNDSTTVSVHASKTVNSSARRVGGQGIVLHPGETALCPTNEREWIQRHGLRKRERTIGRELLPDREEAISKVRVWGLYH